MKRLKKIIRKFNQARILIIGDVMLDEYIWGNVERISPEAPVPVVWAAKRTYVPGGAANVAHNIRSLDARVLLVGVVGKDKNRDTLFAELKKRRISTDGLFSESKRPTTLKSRIVAGHQQVVRVDWEIKEPLTQQLNQKIISFVRKCINDFDAVIIEDYDKGMINRQLVEEIISLARSRNKIITVDPKEEHFQFYQGVSSITPNRKELENAIRNLKIKDTTNSFKLTSDRLSTDKDINRAGREILEYLGLGSLVVTLGEHGMRVFEKNGRISHIPTVAQEVFDVSGAGDTVIAAFSLALACKAPVLEAAHIANYAAGIVVGKIGTAVTTRKELLERIG